MTPPAAPRGEERVDGLGFTKERRTNHITMLDSWSVFRSFGWLIRHRRRILDEYKLDDYATLNDRLGNALKNIKDEIRALMRLLPEDGDDDVNNSKTKFKWVLVRLPWDEKNVFEDDDHKLPQNKKNARPPSKIIDSWMKGTLARFFGQETWAKTILQCGITPKVMETYKRERDREHKSQTVLTEVASVSGHAALGCRRQQAQAKLKAANHAYDDVRRRSKNQNRIEQAKDQLLSCQQLYDDLTIQLGTGLTSAKETLPEIRVRGVAARVAMSLAGSQASTEKCVYCGWWGDLVLCYLCHAEVCTWCSQYIGGGAKVDGKRIGGASSSCVQRDQCYQHQLDNDRRLPSHRSVS